MTPPTSADRQACRGRVESSGTSRESVGRGATRVLGRRWHAEGQSPVDLVFALVYNGLVDVNIHQAKTHLSRLLERVALGEEIVIAKAGKPVARLVPVERPAVKRVLGTAKGDFVVPDDFDAPLPEEVLAEFFK